MHQIFKKIAGAITTSKPHFMTINWKTGAILLLIIAGGVFGGLKLNEVVNNAKTVPPAKG